MERSRMTLGALVVFSLVAVGFTNAEDSSARSEKTPSNRIADTQLKPEHLSLVDRLALEHEILWDKAVASYKAKERQARLAVSAENFDSARRLMDEARQTIDAARRFAGSAGRYESLVHRADEMSRFLDDEARHFEERLIREKRREIAEREKVRLEQERQTRAKSLARLMDRARALQEQRRFDEAVQVLDQVLVAAPRHETARRMRETLDDQAMNRRDQQAVRDRWTEGQDVLVQNDEAGIPYQQDLRYPKNWPEISARRVGTTDVTESRENVQARRRLDKVAPEIRFDALPFEDVINRLRALTGLNIVANWSALESSAVERDAEVSLRLDGVKFEKALELILDEVGGGEVDLGYDIDDGVIQISTREDLSRKTTTKVYNVEDLVIPIPTFPGRRINLSQIGQSQGQSGGIGGGRFVGAGGGAGGQSQGGGSGLFDDDGNDNDNLNNGPQLNPLIPIITLIQGSIDPASWRSAGGNVGSVSALNQQLIVTQTSGAQAQLRDLLRAAKSN